MSKLHSALLESEKKETGEILGTRFTLMKPAVKCRAARSSAGIPMETESSVNTLCFPIELTLNGKLTCAMNGTSGPFLMESPGNWKAMLACTEQQMSVTASASAADLGEINACAIFLWFLTLPDRERDQKFEQASFLLESAVRHFREGNVSDFTLSVMEFFDAFFCECRAAFPQIDIVSKINPMETEISNSVVLFT